jgi:hypothetical protein
MRTCRRLRTCQRLAPHVATSNSSRVPARPAGGTPTRTSPSSLTSQEGGRPAASLLLVPCRQISGAWSKTPGALSCGPAMQIKNRSWNRGSKAGLRDQRAARPGRLDPAASQVERDRHRSQTDGCWYRSYALKHRCATQHIEVKGHSPAHKGLVSLVAADRRGLGTQTSSLSGCVQVSADLRAMTSVSAGERRFGGPG